MKRNHRRLVHSCLLGAAALPLAIHAQQGAYPAKPVVVVVPAGPGSVSETEGRIHLSRLGEILGQQFVLDFKGGGGGIVGLGHVARSAPDGYTLGLVSATYSLIPLRNTSMPFDRLNAFSTVSLLSKRWGLMMVHPSLPSSVADFVAFAKANPGRINYGSSGMGSQQHLTGAWMASLANLDLTYVHYKGAGPIVPDLLAGRVHMTPMTLTSGLPHIKSGKLKTLGLANTVRNPALPDIPTLHEQGWKDFEYSSWLGLIAPAKTPAAVVSLLSVELSRVVKSPEVVKRLSVETDLVGSTPAEFARHVNAETERWRVLLKTIGVTLDE